MVSMISTTGAQSAGHGMRRDGPGSAGAVRASRCAVGVEDAAGVEGGTGVAVQVGDTLGDAGTVHVGKGGTAEGGGVVDKVEVGTGVEGIGVVVDRGVPVLVAVAVGSSVAVGKKVGVVETGGEAVSGGVGEGTKVSVDLPAGEDASGFGERVGTVWRWGPCTGVAHAVRASEPRMMAPPTRSARTPCPGFGRGYRFMRVLLFGRCSLATRALRRRVPCESAPQGRHGPGPGIEQVAGGIDGVGQAVPGPPLYQPVAVAGVAHLLVCGGQ
jgi:hypothetical protein